MGDWKQDVGDSLIVLQKLKMKFGFILGVTL